MKQRPIGALSENAKACWHTSNSADVLQTGQECGIQASNHIQHGKRVVGPGFDMDNAVGAKLL